VTGSGLTDRPRERGENSHRAQRAGTSDVQLSCGASSLRKERPASRP
jgi:hypothetical protein